VLGTSALYGRQLPRAIVTGPIRRATRFLIEINVRHFYDTYDLSVEVE
jgi:hypothetical protein